MTTVIARNLKSLNKELLSKNLKKKKIGLVPTMGAIHKGHLALINKSLKSAEKTIVSIFVNPIQFNSNEDLKNYPSSIEQDIKLLKQKKVDLIFMPKVKDMYPDDFSTYLNLKKFDDILCGKKRKKHFSGVATVVLKLFSLIKPQIAFFGEKDYQQFIIIKKLVKDLNLDIKVVKVKTVRNEKGLALSSRNRLLSQPERDKASKIYSILKSLSLKNLKKSLKNLDLVKSKISALGIKNIEYLEVRDEKFLELYKPKIDTSKAYRVFVAVKIGKIRLIDNLKLT